MKRYRRKTGKRGAKERKEPYRELVASVDSREARICLLEDGGLTELFIERTAQRRLVGNIYKGTVKSVLPGIEAAFVDVGLGKNGFLYVSDVTDAVEDYEYFGEEDEEELRPKRKHKRRARIEDMLKRGQEIMVQVVKEPMGQKGMRLTNYISLPGRYLVLMPTVNHLGVSRKIEDEKERERLRKIAAQARPEGLGLIVRTLGEGKGKEEIEADVKYLSGLWQKILRRMESMHSPSLLHQDLGQVARVVRDVLDDDIDRFVIDSKPDYDTVLNLLENLAPHLKSRVELYRGQTALFEKYDIEPQIEKALRKKVWLPSGGYLVIDQAEALTTIDVNTGKFTGKKKLEDTVFTTNMEAAREVARQVRLRDIGGIILVDFIDMEKPSNRGKLLAELEQAFKTDRSKSYILGMTELGVVQMTRKRTKLSLTPSLCEPCPYCDGSGWVKSITTTMLQILRQLEKQCKENSQQAVTLTAHKDVVERLLADQSDTIAKIEQQYSRKITLKPSSDCHLEFFSITETGSGELLEYT
ncbi:MAG: Rne/Rng family ribonuclease [Candidatus Abyssobacteria bacterium SURF_17]|jgi:ribonuclease G|uniref:Ribonuclease G n=1 Tax=Candidatus Abyssobacteria bacterium SURF_17 TaxID=2093361 RepID=A0A419F3Z0_9BACT|nr:MAG: Rne/Rng family ribonuclease [Candidatus Abyssubacteria bacterium SURF_17]